METVQQTLLLRNWKNRNENNKNCEKHFLHVGNHDWRVDFREQSQKDDFSETLFRLDFLKILIQSGYQLVHCESVNITIDDN